MYQPSDSVRLASIKGCVKKIKLYMLSFCGTIQKEFTVATVVDAFAKLDECGFRNMSWSMYAVAGGFGTLLIEGTR